MQPANRVRAAGSGRMGGGLCGQRRPTGEHTDAPCNSYRDSHSHVDVHRHADVDALSEPLNDMEPDTNAVADQHAGSRGD